VRPALSPSPSQCVATVSAGLRFVRTDRCHAGSCSHQRRRSTTDPCRSLRYPRRNGSGGCCSTHSLRIVKVHKPWPSNIRRSWLDRLGRCAKVARHASAETSTQSSRFCCMMAFSVCNPLPHSTVSNGNSPDMFIDFERATDLPFAPDICVAGTGIAGMTLVSALRQRGLKVLVLEGDGLTHEPRSQSLFESEMDFAGALNIGVVNGRFRVFGGAGTRWSGALIPLAAQELSAKSTMSRRVTIPAPPARRPRPPAGRPASIDPRAGLANPYQSLAPDRTLRPSYLPC
jgi:hypothetical protein